VSLKIDKDMKELITGGTGLFTSIVATPLILDSPNLDNAVINAVVQLIIVVATLVGLIKKKTKK
jgi:hypothetical protein